MVLFFVILRIGKIPNQKLIESKGLVLEFNHPKYFLPDSLVFFFFSCSKITPSEADATFSSSWLFRSFFQNQLLFYSISHQIHGPVPHMSSFLVRVMPVEHIKRLRVHKDFIVGIILVYHCVYGDGLRVSGSSAGIKNIFRKVTFHPQGQFKKLILSLFIEVSFAKELSS